MSRIDSEYVEKMALLLHGIVLDREDAATLAGMLAPMDDAGEALATKLAFDMEPSAFDRVMQREAHTQDGA